MKSILKKISNIFLLKEAKPRGFENVSEPFRVLVVTDCHGTLSRYVRDFMEDVRQVDLVLYLGDLELSDYAVLEEYDKVKNAKKYGVVGNHDDFDDLVSHDIEDIHGKAVKFGGITMVGIRGSFKYKDVNGPMMTDEESEAFVETLPSCDLLVTHDWSKHEEIGNTAHKGMLGITKYIEKYSPAYHIHGHIHEQLEEMVHQTISYSFFKLAYLEVSQDGIELLKAYGKKRVSQYANNS